MKYIVMIVFFVFFTHAMDQHNKTLGYFECLPLEIQGKMIKDVLCLFINDSDVLKKSFDIQLYEKTKRGDKKRQERVPNLSILGIQFTHRLPALQSQGPLIINKKEFSVLELYSLSQKACDALIRVKNRSSFLKGDLGESDIQTLIRESDNKALKGLSLKVSRLNYKMQRVDGAATFFLMTSAASLFFMPVSGFLSKVIIDYLLGLSIFSVGAFGGLEIFIALFRDDLGDMGEYTYTFTF